MDWLEEKWETLKQNMKNKGLLRGMCYYLLLGIFSAAVLAYLTRNICLTWEEVLLVRDSNRNYDIDAEMALAQFLHYYGLYLYICIASFLSLRLFYAQRLRPAVSELKNMLGSLSLGDYGHSIAYRSEDEMGELCKEAEYLRTVLEGEKKRQWESEEEQRRVNAAFAHDLRTPLTVMEGYTEYLLKYIPQGKISQEVLLEKLETLRMQQERLLAFSKTMTEIRRIGERTVNGSWEGRGDFCDRLRKMTETLAGTMPDLNWDFETENMKSGEIFADWEMILEVFENLLHNAFRYAEHTIKVHVRMKGRRLTVSVIDDGPGFSPKALRSGKDVYFSETKEGGDHFGIGLYISKTLCEKHGGNLTLVNSVELGAIAMAEFLCRCR